MKDSKIELTFYSGPGHGWLRVPIKFLQDTKYSTWTISSYSYHDRTFVYLEEDSDCPKFIKWLEEKKIDHEILEKSIEDESFIRNLVRTI